mmetsp:Transcript_18107/g.25331  ORF Transcript_18107/g.25331 Transcript_18107/m.25331 type:complete len:102 (+) Transcript_18107:278-583(+)
MQRVWVCNDVRLDNCSGCDSRAAWAQTGKQAPQRFIQEITVIVLLIIGSLLSTLYFFPISLFIHELHACVKPYIISTNNKAIGHLWISRTLMVSMDVTGHW